MANQVTGKRVDQFGAFADSLGELDSGVTASLIAAASDIALVIEPGGTISDLAVGGDETLRDVCAPWLGRAWIDTVTIESRGKVESLLKEAASGKQARWREVNHTWSRTADLPIRYSTIRLGDSGRIIAFGRDMRGVASLQQRLMTTQLSMERDYARMREAETRYRLLFQLSNEAVLIIDADTMKVVDANPIAVRMTGRQPDAIIGSRLSELFEPSSAGAVDTLLAATRTIGHGDEIDATLAGDGGQIAVSASLFRQESSAYLLVRFSVTAKPGDVAVSQETSAVLDVVSRLPDAFVVTDHQRRILEANTAFVELIELATVEQVRGQPLDHWFDRPGVDFNVLVSNLREHGAVRRFATVMRGEYGGAENVEIAAVAVPHGSETLLGFSIRSVDRTARLGPAVDGFLPRSVEQLTDLIGQMSLKDVVRETTDVIERLCIEAALELTGDNRASAAQVLGLSRQSLYAKLRRHGLGDLNSDGDDHGVNFGQR